MSESTEQIHLKLNKSNYDLLKKQADSYNMSINQFLNESLRKTVRDPYPFIRNELLYKGKTKKKNFKFIDLFAGIGATRLAYEWAGGECVFSSEYEKYAKQTYRVNFGDTPAGDITDIAADDIPNFDVLLAGFPCQPFSIAGVSKKISLGRSHGFEDKNQGNLFFEIARILEAKRPKAFMLENVKNLKSHDKGNTYKVIKGTLEDLGYWISDKVIDARYVVPQHRERIYIVGFDKKVYKEMPKFTFPMFPEQGPAIKSILENADDKYHLSDKLWNYLQNYAKKHKAKGNGFGFGLVDDNATARTLSARYYKDGSEILYKTKGKKNPRRLTPRECARLMGFPDEFIIPVSDTQAYKQFGNSMVLPVVQQIAVQLVKQLKKMASA